MSTRFSRRVARLLCELLLGWLLVSLGYCLMSRLPGSPARALLSEKAPDASVRGVERELDSVSFYRGSSLDYLKATLLFWSQRSWRDDQPVIKKVAAHSMKSLQLALLSLLFIFAMLAASVRLSGKEKGRLAESLIGLVETVLLALPPCLSAILLLLTVGTALRPFLPLGQQGSGMLLGALTLALALFPSLNKLMRVRIREEIAKPYMQICRQRGISSGKTAVKYLLLNTAGAASSQLLLQIGGIVSGVIVVERIFMIEGIGWLTMSAVRQRDLPVLQAIFVLSFLLFFLLAKLSAGLNRRPE